MSRWDDQFEEHELWNQLSRARDQLVTAAEVATGEEEGLQLRIGRVLDYVEGALRSSDPELIPMASLSRLEAALSTLADHVQQFATSPADNSLSQANEQADALLSHAATLPGSVAPDDVQELQTAISAFRRSAGQHLGNIERDVGVVGERASEIADALAAHETKLEAQDARLDNVVAQFQEQFSTAQDQRQTESSQALEEARTEARTNIEELKGAIAEATSGGKSELGALLEETRVASVEALTDAKEQSESQLRELASKGEERMQQLDELQAKAVKAVGAIGSTGMSGGYQIVANRERGAANIWRLVAVLALICAIGATIYAVAHGVTGTFQASKFFAKWAISIPFIALAGYAATESSKHREQARLNRQIELQLASLDAYLVSLPQPEQDRIRAELAERFFGALRTASESIEHEAKST
jgi:hypothetical protein